MLAIQHATAFAGLMVGILGIAATLWLEIRRDQRRQRLVSNIESVLKDADLPPKIDQDLKRAA
jgi:hypothetical protein